MKSFTLEKCMLGFFCDYVQNVTMGKMFAIAKKLWRLYVWWQVLP